MKLFNPALLFSAMVGLFIASSCSKTTDLGLSLVELERSNIVYTDTLSLELSVIQNPAISANNPARWLIGQYQDAVFGESRAGVYFNFKLSTSNLSFPNSSFDSLVLCVQYDSVGHQGDILGSNPSAQDWNIYRLSEDIAASGQYKNDTSFGLGALVANAQFIPSFRDSVMVDTVKTAPHIRIRLDDALGQELLQPADSTVYSNNSRFKDFFKGLHIKAASDGSVVRFLPQGAQTQLVLYYTQQVDGVATRKKFSFLPDTSAVLSTQHDFGGAMAAQNDPNDSLAYLLGLNGLSIKVKFPTLPNLGKIVVNQAELIVHSSQAGSSEQPLPKQVIGVYYNSSTERFELISDAQISVNRFRDYRLFGGGISEQNGLSNSYKMSISSFLQDIVDNKIVDSAFYIRGQTILEPDRLSVGNQRHSQLRPSLRLTYTVVE